MTRELLLTLALMVSMCSGTVCPVEVGPYRNAESGDWDNFENDYVQYTEDADAVLTEIYYCFIPNIHNTIEYRLAGFTATFTNQVTGSTEEFTYGRLT